MGDRKRPTPPPNPAPRKPEPPPAPPRKRQPERAIIRVPERPEPLEEERAPRALVSIVAPTPQEFVPRQCTGTCRALLRTRLDEQLHRCDPISVMRRESVMEQGS